eukprot:g59597.t1
MPTAPRAKSSQHGLASPRDNAERVARANSMSTDSKSPLDGSRRLHENITDKDGAFIPLRASVILNAVMAEAENDDELKELDEDDEDDFELEED